MNEGMTEEQYLILHQLFDSVGIIEKGIEKFYHYLLVNKRIDNLKEVCDHFNFTLKRGYKISSVLSDLELVQIYDRPMKIILNRPILPIWQKIVNNQIEKLKIKLKENIDYCETSFETFIDTYELEEDEVEQEPIEFLVLNSIKNLESLYYPFSAKNKCNLALGIRYENILATKLKNKSSNEIKTKYKDQINNALQKIRENLSKIDIKVVFNDLILKELLNSQEYKLLIEIISKKNFKFKDFKVKITSSDFSNFILIDDELMQPSFDPSNKLLGAYISRNQDIYQVFKEKFEELFMEGIPINQYLKHNKELSVSSLSNFENFLLCLL